MNGEANLRRWNSEPQLIPAEANNKHGENFQIPLNFI